MPYIVVTEFESTGETSCKIMGLTNQSETDLKADISKDKINFVSHKDYFEVDIHGVQVLNFLDKQGYRVISQSMAIEYTTIGGRSVKIQRIVWTLCLNQ